MKETPTNSRAKPSIDRISSLPSSVFAHILSFLPIKDSVATSLLSKRWKSTWRYSSKLNFCHVGDRVSSDRKTDKNNVKYMKFANFVTRVLLLHDVKCIDTMSFDFLDANMVFDPVFMDNINNWVATAVARKINTFKLYGYYYCASEFQLPNCIFNCNSLKILDLGYTVKLSPSGVIHLPCLQILRLTNVGFECDESFRKLISGCSTLHTLYIDRIKHDNVQIFSVRSLTLQHLSILSKNYDVRKHYGSKLEIIAPALTYLHINDLRFMDFTVERLPSLVEATITFHNHPQYDHTVQKELFDGHWKSVGNLIQAIYNVKILFLDAYAFDAVGHSGLSPRFLRLTKLTVTHCCGYQKLLELLQGSNTLKTLILKENPRYHRLHDNWTTPKRVPECVLSSLKVVSIDGFSDREDHVAMVEYILENAGLLEQMCLKTVYMDVSKIFQSFQKILNFERKSKKCKVEFS